MANRVGPTSPQVPASDEIKQDGFRALFDLRESGMPPPDLVPGNEWPKSGYRILARSNNSEATGRVLGYPLIYYGTKIRTWMGLEPLEPPLPQKMAVDSLMESVMAPLPQAQGIAQGQQQFRVAQGAQITETRAFEVAQYNVMGPLTKGAYQQTRQEVVNLYEAEKLIKDEYLRRRAQVRAPDVSGLQAATMARDQAIRANPYLQSRGINVQEFQILQKRREYEETLNPVGRLFAGAYTYTEDEKSFLRARAFGQEFLYVRETIANAISHMMKRGAKEAEWKPMEDLAVDAEKIYLRLVEGEELRGGDLEKLRLVRATAFPYEMDWNKWRLAELATVKSGWDQVKAHEEAFKASTKRYMLGMGDVAMRLNRQAELTSMAREKLDYEFQMVRLKEEFSKVEIRGVNAADRAHFDDLFKRYEKEYKKYREYWEGFISGDDVKAREHARNAKDKMVDFMLVMELQLALYDLFEKYNVPGLPSAVSLSYNNTMRTVDEAVSNNRTSWTGIRDFFRELLYLAPEIAKEIGIKDVGIKGRRVLDLNHIDGLAANLGLSSFGNGGKKVVYVGMDGKSYLMAQTPPHSLAHMMSGAQTGLAGLQLSDDVSRQSVFWRGNHNGIMEFWTMLGLGILGFEAPQQAQGGAAKVPMVGDYLRQRAVVVERDEGSGNANAKIMQFLMRETPILSYTAGTRIVSIGGSHFFIDYRGDPSQVLAYGIVTDRATSGQDAKIFREMNETAGRTGYGVIVANLIHDGSRRLPEPTWFLGAELTESIVGNSDIRTMLNFGPRDVPTHVGIGQVLHSAGYPTEAEWKTYAPTQFRDKFGNMMSERQTYFQTLQLPAAVMTADQRLTAASFDLVVPPPISAQQTAKKAELDRLSEDARRQKSMEEVDKHIRARMGRLATAQGLYRSEHEANFNMTKRQEVVATKVVTRGPGAVPEVDKKEKGRKLSDTGWVSGMNQLEAAWPAEQARAVLLGGGAYSFDRKNKNKKKAALGLHYLTEAAQWGAAVAKNFKGQGLTADALALDLDKIMWDHFFPLGAEKAKEVWNAEFNARVQRNGSRFNLEEIININPLWVAFMKGYKKEFGRPPILFSSTMAPRLAAIATHIDKEPLVKEFFEIVLERPGITSAQAQVLLTPEALNANPRIITRTDIASKTAELMGRFRNNGYTLAGFSDIEKEDFKSSLRNYHADPFMGHHADVHLKLRSIVPYTMLVDDRSENIDAAVAHAGVTGIEIQPWTESPRLYVTTNIESDWKQRLNQARSGQALGAMRMMLDPEARGRKVVLENRNKMERVPGLFDSFVRISYSNEMRKTYYDGPRDIAGQWVGTVRDEVRQRVILLRQRQSQIRRDLIALFNDPQLFVNPATGVATAFPVLALKDASEFLNPDMRDKKTGALVEIKSVADFEIIENVVRNIPDPAKKTRAQGMVTELKKRDLIDLYEETIDPKDKRKRSGKQSALGTIKKYWGKAAKHVPLVGGALALTGQHVVGSMLESELRPLSIARNLATRDGWKLIKLGRYMGGKTDDMFWKALNLGRLRDKDLSEMPVEEQIDAYGIVADRLIRRYGNELVDTMATDARLSEGFRAKVGEDKKEFKKAVDQMASGARQMMAGLAEAYMGAVELAEGFKTLMGDEDHFYDNWILEGALELVREKVSPAIQRAEAERKRVWASRGDINLTSLDTNSQFAYIVLSGLQDFVGGRNSALGALLEEAKANLLEMGFETAFRTALDLPKEIQNLMKNKTAQDVAKRMIEGSPDRAEARLRSAAIDLKVAYDYDQKKAKEEYTRLGKAVWVMSLDTDRRAVDTMIERIYNEVFPNGNGISAAREVARAAAPAPTPMAPVPVATPVSPAPVTAPRTLGGLGMSLGGGRLTLGGLRASTPVSVTGRGTPAPIVVAPVVAPLTPEIDGLLDGYALLGDEFGRRRREGRIPSGGLDQRVVDQFFAGDRDEAQSYGPTVLALGVVALESGDENLNLEFEDLLFELRGDQSGSRARTLGVLRARGLEGARSPVLARSILR